MGIPPKQPKPTWEVLIEEFKQIHPDKHVTFVQPAKQLYERLNPGGDWKKLRGKEWRRWCEAAYYKRVHELKREKPEGQTALCLSGGGIRSAAFALGVLQGLAERGLLKQFHYLSTVSGGGYVGAWLTAWASRAATAHAQSRMGFAEVECALGGKEAPEPLRRLRGRQAYLTPKTGPGSPDTWAALAHVVRNLLLNWLVFVPLLAALLMVPRVVEAVLLSVPPNKCGSSLENIAYFAGEVVGLYHGHACILSLRHWEFWLDTLAFLLVLLGLGFSMVNRATATGRDAIGDSGFFKWVLVPVVSGAFCLLAATCAWFPGVWCCSRTCFGFGSGSAPSRSRLFASWPCAGWACSVPNKVTRNSSAAGRFSERFPRRPLLAR
jgi:hypothetical protein